MIVTLFLKSLITKALILSVRGEIEVEKLDNLRRTELQTRS